MLAEIIADTLTLRLFSNNITPAAADVAGTYTEVTGGGYAALALGAASNWTVTANNPASATYNTFKQFDFTGGIGGSGNVYGYYITRASGEVVFAQRFPEGSIPFTPINTSFVKVQPVITLDNATSSTATQALSVLSKTANYSVVTSDGDDVLVLVNATSGAVVISLYTAVSNTGKKIRVIKTDATANTVTVDPSGAETLDGALTAVLYGQYDGIGVTSTGTTWIRFDQASTVGQVLSKTADYTITVQDGNNLILLADATGAAVTITLPTAVGHKGFTLLVKKTDTSTNIVTVDGNAAETLDGALIGVLSIPYTWMQLVSDGSNWRVVGQTHLVNPQTNGGRLTLTTATPVTTADVTAATTLYFTPYTGNLIALYDGTGAWVTRSFAELALSLVGLTASKPYDIFAYDNSGVVALEALVWTDATTRATALTRVGGVLVKSGATTRRYIGSVYINSSGGQTDDSYLKRNVFNADHRVSRSLRRIEATASWTYASGTWRQANASTANQLECMIGVDEDPVSAEVIAAGSTGTIGDYPAVAIGLDSTSTAATGLVMGNPRQDTTSYERIQHARLLTHIGVGRHLLVWLESRNGSGTATFLGASSIQQSGIIGIVRQ